MVRSVRIAAATDMRVVGRNLYLDITAFHGLEKVHHKNKLSQSRSI